MERLRAEPSEQHDLEFDWTWEGDETDEEAKIRAETRKILELPKLPLSATTVRVPVLVGHAQSVWIETEKPLTPEHAEAVLARELGTARLLGQTTGAALVALFLARYPVAGTRIALLVAVAFALGGLVKGAALNALQIAELLLDGTRSATQAA